MGSVLGLVGPDDGTLRPGKTATLICVWTSVSVAASTTVSADV